MMRAYDRASGLAEANEPSGHCLIRQPGDEHRLRHVAKDRVSQTKPRFGGVSFFRALQTQARYRLA